VKEQLDRLVLEMYRSGLPYAKAIQEFQRTFIAAVLREQNGNQVRAAEELEMHRNTLRRNIAQLEVDMEAVRMSRHPPVSTRLNAAPQKKTNAK
jgi:Fis family transcriptional regulator, factor for inversion stimulation protein